MLKVPKRLHLLVIVAMTFTATAFAGSVAAGSALADGGHQWESDETPATLNGDWAPLNRCPVDDPTMLAADGAANIPFCLAVNSPNGSLTIGGLTVPLKGSNLQMGIVLNNETGASTVAAPPGGAVLDESIEIPNGLQALICPSPGRLARRLCRPHRDGRDNGDNEHSHELNDLTVSMVSAGDPSNFSLGAGLSLNQPLISLPVKIHLQNQLLGKHCYIGSDTEPIVVQPENTTAPTLGIEVFDENGTPDPSGKMAEFQLHASQGAGSFAVPTATGCGFMGSFDEAIDGHAGLPSAAGNNKLVLNETSTYIALLSTPEPPNAGKDLSKSWHSAVLPEAQEEEGQEEDRRHRHEHGH
jgi:hypothetical protein